MDEKTMICLHHLLLPITSTEDAIQHLGTKMGFKYHNVWVQCVWAWDLIQNANVKKLHITTYKQQSSVPIDRKNK
jgi:hypothetical protein